ncbi:outer membrane protein [Rhodocyclus tenuis]|uniref:outer membrane protein n=1 Tax=Rhodocyclus tenuis TaxID=1066 RepID=UPI001902CE80|nr:outer membrane beta-barrel protein [Rhodocyclus tenuis]MBK1679178.1 hypothetical protein [Rhodocyclus tenuis]
MKQFHRLHLASLSLMIFSVSPAIAGDANFTGFTLGATAGLAHNEISYSGYIDGKSSSKNDWVAGLNAAYAFALGESVVLSAGASYAINDTKFGQVTYPDGAQTVSVNGKLKDHWTVFVAPGYRFAPQWLGYAKVAYHEAKSDFTDTLMGSGTAKHHGVGYGIGAAYAVSRNIEVSAEAQQVRLSSASFALSSGKPTVTEFNLGVNYRF